MSIKIQTLGAICAFSVLSACAGSGIGDNDTERAVIGAAGGALIADATENDVATGAAVGALAGVFCDDAGVCRQSN
ncbi:hypothetical protein AADZ90_007655 [Aestuariibius sp. 2305UL40-4]|uniref:hypothetical protein n=1 Tax=Aestuariibius violaceus TaxID=3234132 RepID=UPI00345E4360